VHCYWISSFHISDLREDNWPKKPNYSENEQTVPRKCWFPAGALWKWRSMWCCSKILFYLYTTSHSRVQIQLYPLKHFTCLFWSMTLWNFASLFNLGTATTIGYFGAYTSVNIKISWIGFLLSYAQWDAREPFTGFIFESHLFSGCWAFTMSLLCVI
jgi:hypothetical protein